MTQSIIFQQHDTELAYLLKLESVYKRFGAQQVLSGVDLKLKAGSSLSVLGAGGSGKSTLLKIILGLVRPDAGVVEVFGKNMFSLSAREQQSLRKKIGMAFQQGALFDFMTVRENIIFAMENMCGLKPEACEDRIRSMLQTVDLLHAINKLPSELSGGMRRRVGIVRALAIEPKLALFDEPTAGLDPVTSTLVIDMIHELARIVGSTLVCVTSSVEVAFTFASRVAVLHEGKIRAEGTWEELHKRTEDPWLLHFLDVRGFVPKTAEQKL